MSETIDVTRKECLAILIEDGVPNVIARSILSTIPKDAKLLWGDKHLRITDDKVDGDEVHPEVEVLSEEEVERREICNVAYNGISQIVVATCFLAGSDTGNKECPIGTAICKRVSDSSLRVIGNRPKDTPLDLPSLRFMMIANLRQLLKELVMIDSVNTGTQEWK